MTIATCPYCTPTTAGHEPHCPFANRPILDVPGAIDRISERNQEVAISAWRERVRLLEAVVQDMAGTIQALTTERDKAVANNVTLSLVPEEQERHMADYRQEIAKLHQELESYEREIMEWIAIVFQLREAAQYVLAQHGYESLSLAALGKLLA